MNRKRKTQSPSSWIRSSSSILYLLLTYHDNLQVLAYSPVLHRSLKSISSSWSSSMASPFSTTSRTSSGSTSIATSIHDTPWTKRLAFLHQPQKHLLDTSKLYARKKKVEEEEEEEEYEEDIVAEYEEEVEEEDEEYYEEEYDDEEEEEEEEYEDDVDEDEDLDDDQLVLQDDPEDENYMAQKKAIEESIERRTALQALQDHTTGVEATGFLKENVEDFLNKEWEDAIAKGVIDADTVQQAEDLFNKMSLTEKEAEAAIETEEKKEDELGERTQGEEAKEFLTKLGKTDDVFPPEGDPIYGQDDDEEVSIQKADLVRLQNAMEELTGTIEGFQDGSLIDNKQAMIRPQYELDQLDRETLEEINLCLNASAVDPTTGIDYDESIKNEDPIRWLLYDLDFNVTNLMLASCKHNPEAPMILNHWMPQLCSYSRYASERDRGFRFTFEDCEAAELDELERYYQGLGYDEIPKMTPKETNIVELETEYDPVDMSMSALENWMSEVYYDEDENLYFDDEEFQPENNVFDSNYGLDDSGEVTSFKNEFRDFEAEHVNETQAWKDRFAVERNFTHVVDEEGAQEFRGHLVVSCCGSDHDLALAEKITLRMGEEFGKQVYVETRVYNHARQEDNVYEIWLESYTIELLHSRRGALYNAKQWKGPADVDDAQLDNLVARVGHLISDDARYSYHLHEFFTEVA